MKEREQWVDKRRPHTRVQSGCREFYCPGHREGTGHRRGIRRCTGCRLRLCHEGQRIC